MRVKEKHGLCYSREYNIWCGIRTRALNPNDEFYERYGKRGITICARWRDSFANFIADMGLSPSKKHTIDRINNDGPYSPENCRWATYQQQARNRKTTRWVTFNGETKCIAEWADIVGMGKGTLWYRIAKLGWSPEKALRHRIYGSEYGTSGC